MNNCLYCYKPLESGEFHIACSKRFFGTAPAPKITYSNDEMKELAKEIIVQQVSLTGVQAKLSLHLTNSSSKKDSRFTLVGLWGNFILKPPALEFPFMPEVEDCTMHLAELFKIVVVPHSLIRLASGELAYITRRIDRDQKSGRAIHMEDFCQLSEKLTEQKYRGSMESIAKGLKKYSSNAIFDILTLFEVTIFSFLTGNGDMHLKNFSIIHNENGLITLTPAYDLLSTRLFISEKEDSEELALTLNGKKRKFKKNDFVQFGITCGLSKKQIENSFKKFKKSLSSIDTVINNSFLSSTLKDEFKSIIEKRAVRLNLK